MTCLLWGLACVTSVLMASPSITAADKVRVLIIDGQNNHNWAAMTPPMKAALEKTGRITVDVITTPPAKSCCSGGCTTAPPSTTGPTGGCSLPRTFRRSQPPYEK